MRVREEGLAGEKKILLQKNKSQTVKGNAAFSIMQII